MSEIFSQKEASKKLTDACLQFGHKLKEWNPKMSPYISKEKNGRHLFDLAKTAKLLTLAGNALQKKAAKGGRFLFVGTNKISSQLVSKYAKSSNSYYINYRWLGGMLTNWPTIQKRIARLKDLENLEAKGLFQTLPKKEASKKKKEIGKLQRLFNGIKMMSFLPDAVIFTNQLENSLAINECLRLGIPIISIVDSNSNPELVPYPIPANDDSTSSVEYILSTLAGRILKGYNK